MTPQELLSGGQVSLLDQYNATTEQLHNITLELIRVKQHYEDQVALFSSQIKALSFQGEQLRQQLTQQRQQELETKKAEDSKKEHKKA